MSKNYIPRLFDQIIEFSLNGQWCLCGATLLFEKLVMLDKLINETAV